MNYVQTLKQKSFSWQFYLHVLKILDYFVWSAREWRAVKHLTSASVKLRQRTRMRTIVCDLLREITGVLRLRKHGILISSILCRTESENKMHSSWMWHEYKLLICLYGVKGQKDVNKNIVLIKLEGICVIRWYLITQARKRKKK